MEDEGENVAPQPGHFTKVYLETLRKANQRYVWLSVIECKLSTCIYYTTFAFTSKLIQALVTHEPMLASDRAF